MVTQNDKLYQPILEGGDVDAENWIKNYSEKNQKNPRKRIDLARKTKIMDTDNSLRRSDVTSFQSITLPD